MCVCVRKREGEGEVWYATTLKLHTLIKLEIPAYYSFVYKYIIHSL